MKTNEKILVGRIVAPQGIRGEVRVQTFTENTTDLKGLAVFGNSIESGKFHFLRPVPNTNVIIARIDGIGDRNTAETLRGTDLFIMRDDLPKLKDGEYYQSDLIGFSVVQNGKKVGQIVCFQNFGAGDIIEVDDGNMFRFFGAKVDFENKTVFVE